MEFIIDDTNKMAEIYLTDYFDPDMLISEVQEYSLKLTTTSDKILYLRYILKLVLEAKENFEPMPLSFELQPMLRYDKAIYFINREISAIENNTQNGTPTSQPSTTFNIHNTGTIENLNQGHEITNIHNQKPAAKTPKKVKWYSKALKYFDHTVVKMIIIPLILLVLSALLLRYFHLKDQ